MQNSPVHAIRQQICRICRISARRGSMLPTIAQTGSGTEFSDRFSMGSAHCRFALPVRFAAILLAILMDALQPASGDRPVQGRDLFIGLSIRQQLKGRVLKRQSGRERQLVFP